MDDPRLQSGPPEDLFRFWEDKVKDEKQEKQVPKTLSAKELGLPVLSSSQLGPVKDAIAVLEHREGRKSCATSQPRITTGKSYSFPSSSEPFTSASLRPWVKTLVEGPKEVKTTEQPSLWDKITKTLWNWLEEDEELVDNDRWKEYEERLQEHMKRLLLSLGNSRVEEREALTHAKKELAKLESFQLFEAIPLCRRAKNMTVAAIQAKHDVFKRAIEVVARQAKDIASQGKKLIGQRAREVFIPPSTLFSQDSAFIQLNRRALQVRRWAAHLENHLLEMLMHLPTPTEEHVQHIIQGIVQITEHHDINLHYHEYQERLQCVFDCLLLDERTMDGKRLHTFIRHMLSIVPCEDTGRDVLRFISYFSRQLSEKCALEEVPPSLVEMYISRLVFPRLSRVTFASYNEMDDKFYSAALLLRQQTPQQMDIPEQFFSASYRSGDVSVIPFADAINALEELNVLLTPADMLFCLLTTMRLLHEEAAEHAQVSRNQLGADASFPIFFWVAVHADCPHLSTSCRIMEEFSPSTHLAREFGYCLCTLQAAIVHGIQEVERNKVEE